MTTVKRLPSRPLTPQDLAALDEDDRLQIVPYGGLPDGDDIDIYAVKMAAEETAHALGFDDARGRWQRLASVDGTDLAEADRELDALLDDWISENYGDQFEVLKTA